jgi:hypothetical protein
MVDAGPVPVRIYLAARYTGNRADKESHLPHAAAAAKPDYPHHLESFHYIGHGRFDELIRRNGHTLFLDSGAFSMYTQGVAVDLDKYASFVNKRTDLWDVVSNLDHIGAGGEQKSYENQKYLESVIPNAKVIPVHHARDSDDWLLRYLDEGYDYIALGGMVPESTGYLLNWLDRIWDKYLALPDGSARIKIHGFGLTRFDLMERYPWFSVDSTSWVQTGMFGGILVDVDDRVYKIDVSNSSPSKKKRDKHFDTLDPVTHGYVVDYIQSLGFDMEKLGLSYGYRDEWNITFFRRYMQRCRPLFKRERLTVALF